MGFYFFWGLVEKTSRKRAKSGVFHSEKTPQIQDKSSRLGCWKCPQFWQVQEDMVFLHLPKLSHRPVADQVQDPFFIFLSHSEVSGLGSVFAGKKLCPVDDAVCQGAGALMTRDPRMYCARCRLPSSGGGRAKGQAAQQLMPCPLLRCDNSSTPLLGLLICWSL